MTSGELCTKLNSLEGKGEKVPSDILKAENGPNDAIQLMASPHNTSEGVPEVWLQWLQLIN